MLRCSESRSKEFLCRYLNAIFSPPLQVRIRLAAPCGVSIPGGCVEYGDLGSPSDFGPAWPFGGWRGRPFKTGDLPFSRFVWANLGANINPHQSSGVRMTDTSAAKRVDPVDQGRLALATLAACFVKTFSESDSQFADRFEKYLSDAYDQLGDMPVSNVGAMETLKWTREMLRDR